MQQNSAAYSEYLLEVGIALFNEGIEHIHKSIEVFDAAYAFSPNSSKSLMNAGVALSQMNKFDEAGKYLSRKILRSLIRTNGTSLYMSHLVHVSFRQKSRKNFQN